MDAGLPAGVMNLINGDKVAVDVLLTHPLVKAVSFVGSTPVAKYIYATAAAQGKRVQALGGAKNIKKVESCAETRLRLLVADEAVVDEAALRSAGVQGIIRFPESVRRRDAGPDGVISPSMVWFVHCRMRQNRLLVRDSP
jgi:malonate-semialdehyde dehydrogenase (acetylating)/methylmalonate-semialdehyde dehydrogenase